MAKQLFPKSFITASIEHYTFRIRNRSKAIYLTLTLSLWAIIAAATLGFAVRIPGNITFNSALLESLFLLLWR